LKTLKAHKVVQTNISPDAWLLTIRNEIRLWDFTWAQKTGIMHLDLWDAKSLHGCLAPEVVMGSSHLTSAADISSFGCILFQMARKELPFGSRYQTDISFLAGVAEIIGDSPVEIIASLWVSARHSYLLRQTARPRPYQNLLIPRLPIDYHQLDPLLSRSFNGISKSDHRSLPSANILSSPSRVRSMSFPI
jgi:serine/threonine protein kinase